MDVRTILKCELRDKNVREKIATRQKFHHSRAATGHSGGEDGELCPAKGGWDSPCFLAICLGYECIRRVLLLRYCIIINGAHSVLSKEENRTFARDGGVR